MRSQPHTVAAESPRVEADVDQHLVAAQVGRQIGQPGIIDLVGIHLGGAETNGDAVRVDVGVVAALADRHRHAAPVRVGAVHGGLDQRRVDDRLGDTLGLGGVAGQVDDHLDQRLGPLAVAWRSSW